MLVPCKVEVVCILAFSLLGETDCLVVSYTVLNRFPVPNILRIVYYPIHSLVLITFIYSVGFLYFFKVFPFQIKKD